MNASQNLQQYVKRNIEGASQSDLILLLYDVGINSMNTAKSKLGERDIEGVHNAIMKAIRVLEELIGSLNLDKGGEIAGNLLGLYAYIKRRLTEANASKECAGIDDALELMQGLRSAWKAALAKYSETTTTTTAEPVNTKVERRPSPKPLSISV